MDSTNHQPEPNEKSKKRKSTDPIHLSEDDSDVLFPHFLVVETTNETPIGFSIFTIQKILQCAVGNVKSAKKLRNGVVLFEVDSKQMATRALAMTNWLNIDLRSHLIDPSIAAGASSDVAIFVIVRMPRSWMP